MSTAPASTPSDGRIAHCYRLCLAGGPAGGKTSAMARLSSFLRDRNFVVFTVPEAATMLATHGAHALEFDDDDMRVAYQVAVLRTQIALEDSFHRLAIATGRPAVLLCDRGVLDGKGYVSPALWRRVLEGAGVDEMRLRDARYDAVLHLVTAARGAEAHYTTATNAARTETAAEARRVDARIKEAYVGHPRLVVFGNAGVDFEGKLRRVVDTVASITNLPATKKTFRRFLLLSRPVAVPRHAKTFEVEKVYLRTQPTAAPVAATAAARPRMPPPPARGAEAAAAAEGGVLSALRGAAAEGIRRRAPAAAVGPAARRGAAHGGRQSRPVPPPAAAGLGGGGEAPVEKKRRVGRAAATAAAAAAEAAGGAHSLGGPSRLEEDEAGAVGAAMAASAARAARSDGAGRRRARTMSFEPSAVAMPVPSLEELAGEAVEEDAADAARGSPREDPGPVAEAAAGRRGAGVAGDEAVEGAGAAGDEDEAAAEGGDAAAGGDAEGGVDGRAAGAPLEPRVCYTFVRRRSQGRVASFGETTVYVGANGERIESKRIISAREFAYAVTHQADLTRHYLRVRRTCFIYRGQYVELYDYLAPVGALCILNVQVPVDARDPDLPPFLDVGKEITDDMAYSAYSISLGRLPPAVTALAGHADPQPSARTGRRQAPAGPASDLGIPSAKGPPGEQGF